MESRVQTTKKNLEHAIEWFLSDIKNLDDNRPTIEKANTLVSLLGGSLVRDIYVYYGAYKEAELDSLINGAKEN